jgi:hypothetical protein
LEAPPPPDRPPPKDDREEPPENPRLPPDVREPELEDPNRAVFLSTLFLYSQFGFLQSDSIRIRPPVFCVAAFSVVVFETRVRRLQRGQFRARHILTTNRRVVRQDSHSQTS